MAKRHAEPDSQLGRVVLMRGKSETTPELSVVIPTRDRAEAVERAVASVLDHSEDNVEVVVFDDGSLDATAERIERLSDPRLKLIIADSPGGQTEQETVARGHQRHHSLLSSIRMMFFCLSDAKDL